jgi:dihydrolipoamide dehydrogenase
LEEEAVSEDKTYDVVIIGSGPGGYIAAIRAGQLGLTTAIVEKGELGGVCLNVGCIPAKTLLRHAEVLSLVREAGTYGITTGEISFDLDATMARKEQVVATLRRGVEGLLRKNQVEIVRGLGRVAEAPMRIEGPVGSVDALGEVAVTPSTGPDIRLATRNIVLATGSAPRPLPGVAFDEERILSTTGALSLPEVPRRLGVIGAGPGGVEFAYAYQVFGAEQVVLVEALPRVLPREDADMSDLVAKSLVRRSIRVETSARATEIEHASGEVRFQLTTAGGETEAVTVDRLLVSIGVQPVTDGLGLDAAGVMRDPRGYIVVDETMRTSAPGVWAIGDVTSSPPLANVASAEGIAVVEQIAGLEVEPVDYDKIPRATYCHPEVGAVGLTEEQAREQGYQVRVGKFPFRNNGRALLMGHTEGLAKVVSDARYGEILGVHIFGVEATTLLGEAGVALDFEYTDEDLGLAPHAHPTLAEILQEAALAATGQAIHR